MPEPDLDERLRLLLEQYRHVIRRAIRRYASAGSGLDPDDIEQDACIRVWRALSEQRELGRPASYLYRVAVNASLDAWRRLRARREEPLSGPGEEERSLPSVAMESPECRAQQRQKVDQIQTALGRLAINRRRAVALHLQGFTTTEIGRLRDWTEPKARNLVYRGLGDLKALLEEVPQ